MRGIFFTLQTEVIKLVGFERVFQDIKKGGVFHRLSCSLI